MTDNIILKKENIKRFFIYTEEIKDDEGNVIKPSEKTGEYLEFDLEDIELPFRYQEMIDNCKKNQNEYNNKCLIIDKQQDHKGKKIMSYNEEQKVKALKDYIIKTKDVYNMFLGDMGVEKLLYGRKLGWTTLAEIGDIINKIIAPQLSIELDGIKNKIKEKYSITEEENVLE